MTTRCCFIKNQHPYACTMPPHGRPQSSICPYCAASQTTTVIHMRMQYHLTKDDNHPYAYTVPPHTKHHNHWYTSNQNCCYGTQIALVSFNHSCYWITRLSVGLCGWLSQHSAAASSDLASSDLWNKVQVTVRYCVLLPGEHFRCCPWPRDCSITLS